MSASVSSIRVVPAAGALGIGQYRYIAHIAEGGMADVFLAVTKGSGFEKLFVIKELRASLAADPTFVAMFMDEARLAARLNHPNVVQTYEVGSDGRRYFIAMEFLDGVSYVRMCRLRERLPPPLAYHVRIIADVLHGLHYAHELRDFEGAPLHVVHRDVSPQNVMLTYAGGVKLLDFGIAKAALAAEQRPDDFKGKLEYMAPEQALVENVDRRADIFSVGIMLFEAISRRRFYVKGEDKFARLVGGDYRSLAEARPDAPRKLVEICHHALQRDREKRFATALDMASELEEWLDGTTQHVSARDVGTYIADKFESSRAKIGDAIEAQLKAFRELTEETTDRFRLSRLPVGELTSEVPDGYTGELPAGTIPPGASARGGWPTAPPGAIGSIPAAPLPPMTTGPFPAGSMGAMGSMPPGSFPPPGSLRPSAAAATVRSRESSPGKVVMIVFLAIAVVVGGIFGVLTYLKRREQGRTAAVAPSPTLTAVPVVVAGGDVEFTIRAEPETAKIFLDGQPLEGNPASGTRKRDGVTHVVHVEAPGFGAKDERVPFERSLFLTLELRAAGDAGAVAAAPATPGSSATGGTTSAGGGTSATSGTSGSSGSSKGGKGGKGRRTPKNNPAAAASSGGGLPDNPYQ